MFAWTDEWFRGGFDIRDWDFGLTTRERKPKPALTTVSQCYAEVPFSSGIEWPTISVVVCTYNGSRTIRNTLDGLTKLTYPDYEVIVVDDGSTDHTASIVREYGVRLIQTTNHGLSSARNTGWRAASGEIVAYIDDDAWPDPDWLTYLGYTFMSTAFPAVGGLNLAPPGDGFVAECVANAPGGPVHVLVSDREAEHIPGCNMAFRRTALEAVGGFDTQFRVAGDDVDICWKLQKRGYRIGFSPASMVWHHRRNSVRTYWRQQKGYGKAEAMLHHKWPEKYNMTGHVRWLGRIYGRGVTHPLPFGRSRVYGGVWGTAPFQSLYEPAPGKFLSLALMPEWYLVVIMLVFVSGLATLWSPFTLEWFFLGLAAA
ncbi:MAG: glycosyltransferase, partial [Thermodesulfobacteriota bacterium]